MWATTENYLLAVELLITADKDLFDVLSDIAAAVTVKGTPALISASGDPLKAITEALSAFPTRAS